MRLNRLNQYLKRILTLSKEETNQRVDETNRRDTVNEKEEIITENSSGDNIFEIVNNWQFYTMTSKNPHERFIPYLGYWGAYWHDSYSLITDLIRYEKGFTSGDQIYEQFDKTWNEIEKIKIIKRPSLEEHKLYWILILYLRTEMRLYSPIVGYPRCGIQTYGAKSSCEFTEIISKKLDSLWEQLEEYQQEVISSLAYSHVLEELEREVKSGSVKPCFHDYNFVSQRFIDVLFDELEEQTGHNYTYALHPNRTLFVPAYLEPRTGEYPFAIEFEDRWPYAFIFRYEFGNMFGGVPTCILHNKKIELRNEEKIKLKEIVSIFVENIKKKYGKL